MKLFKNTPSAYFFFSVLLSIFFVPSFVEAQVSPDPLYVTGIDQFEVYPYSSPVSGADGFCVLASFELSQDSTIVMRHTPFANIANPVWTYNPSDINATATDYSFNAIFSNGLTPATEYVIQFIEVDQNGGYHLITPGNLTDDISNMCTPNSNGTLSESCPAGDFVVNDCSPSGVNQAAQGGGGNGPSASVTNVQSGQDSLTFSVETSGFQVGEVLTLVHTTDASIIPSGNFQNAQALSLSVLSAQSVLTVNLTSLQTNTPYYVTVLAPDGSVVIDTASNQPYEVLYTGSQNNGGGNGTQGSGTAGTINVNMTGTFGPSGVEEELQAGFTQCGYGQNYDCDFNAALATIDRIIKFLLYIIVLPVAAILFAWAGIKLIVARAKGKAGAMSEAKELIGRVVVGLIIAMGAWILIKFVLVILGYTDASGIVADILGITT
jgi:hypothetical protein